MEIRGFMEEEIKDKLYTAAEVAEYLDVHTNYVYQLIKNGEIDFCKIGRSYRFTEDQVAIYIKNIENKSESSLNG